MKEWMKVLIGATIVMIIAILVFVVLIKEDCHKDNYTTMSKETIKNEVQKRYNKNLVDHIARISEIAYENGTPIFPRNGFLLGVVRHNGFLPNEGVDADLACFEEDVPKML